MGKGVLYAGPWVGEFGWELAWWNPLVRHRARSYDRTVIASHASSRYLYEFSDEFIPLKTDSGRSFWEGTLDGDPPRVEADAIFAPEEVFSPGWHGRHHGLREWRRLKPLGCVRVADVLCAFRPPKAGVVGKEYPHGMCRELVDLLLLRGLTVACYGGPDNYWFEGSIDLRGCSLGEQCGALGAAKCAIGPSSGTMHLASLCECPVVTWFTPDTHPGLRLRYLREWNPFGAPVAFLKAKPPPVGEVACAARSISRA